MHNTVVVVDDDDDVVVVVVVVVNSLKSGPPTCDLLTVSKPNAARPILLHFCHKLSACYNNLQ